MNIIKGYKMLKYFSILFTLLTLVLAGCSFSDPDPEEIQAQMDQEHARITEEQERQQEEEAEKLLAQEAAAAEETAVKEAAAKEAEATRLAAVDNENALDKIEKLLRPASIEVIQPEEPKSEPNIINTISSGLKNLLGSSVKEQQEAGGHKERNQRPASKRIVMSSATPKNGRISGIKSIGSTR